MRAARSARVVVVVLALGALTLAAGACSSDGSAKAQSTTSTAKPADAVSWPAPANPLVRTRAAGLVPETAESFEHHVHAHLDVFVNGEPVVVPAGLGINIDDPAVHTFDEGDDKAYGGIDPPCAKPCISPLHTHDVTGVIHTESPTNVDNSLGQLFVEWGVKLTPTCVDTYCAPETPVAFYVYGHAYEGDPRKILLTNLKEIAIVIGTPPAEIPNRGDFSSL